MNNYEGENPFVERRELTLDAVVEDYIIKHLGASTLLASGCRKFRCATSSIFCPWCTRRIGEISPEDVDDSTAGSVQYHRQANAVVKDLLTLVNFAMKKLHFRGKNPAHGIIAPTRKSPAPDSSALMS